MTSYAQLFAIGEVLNGLYEIRSVLGYGGMGQVFEAYDLRLGRMVAVKAALPGRSFAVGSLISIAVRGVTTVAELMYVGAVTVVGRRQGWTIPTGILHPSPEEREASTEETAAHAPEIL